MTAETVGQPRGSALALPARTRKPWQRRMESAGGRSPRGRAAVTVNEALRSHIKLSPSPGNFSPDVVAGFLQAAGFLPFACSLITIIPNKDKNRKDGQQQGQGRINLPGGPCSVRFSHNDSKTTEAQKDNLEKLVLYCVRVYSPYLEQPWHCWFTWEDLTPPQRKAKHFSTRKILMYFFLFCFYIDLWH